MRGGDMNRNGFILRGRPRPVALAQDRPAAYRLMRLDAGWNYARDAGGSLLNCDTIRQRHGLLAGDGLAIGPSTLAKSLRIA